MITLSVWFLILALFVPRISLLALWLQGLVPPNPTPFVADVLLTIFLPRVLVLILIAVTQGYDAWFWVHLVVAIIVWLRATGSVYTSASRRSY